MAVTLVAAWLVGGRSARRRKWGFWVFVLSNLLWCVWGAFSHSYALIVLQLGLFAMNLRGARKNEKSRPNEDTVSEGDHDTGSDDDIDIDSDSNDRHCNDHERRP